MTTDRVDNDRCAVPFPLIYCLVCRAPLVVIVSRENDKFIQKIDCRTCNRMQGEIYGNPDSMLAEGIINLGDIKEVYHPSFLLHHVEVEIHRFQGLELWTSRAM